MIHIQNPKERVINNKINYKYHNSFQYYGTELDGLPTGEGYQLTRTGQIYYGHFLDGQRFGKGIEIRLGDKIVFYLTMNKTVNE